jgi:hypothetical protein
MTPKPGYCPIRPCLKALTEQGVRSPPVASTFWLVGTIPADFFVSTPQSLLDGLGAVNPFQTLETRRYSCIYTIDTAYGEIYGLPAQKRAFYIPLFTRKCSFTASRGTFSKKRYSVQKGKKYPLFTVKKLKKATQRENAVENGVER